MSPRFPIFLTLLGLALLAPPAGRADIQKPAGSGSVPLARDTVVKVLRGESAEIKLEGSTSTTTALKFILRGAPKLGKLESSAPQYLGKEQALVRYTATPGLTGATDSFTFATQVEGGRASDPATVTIHISDAAPVIEASPLIETGRFLTTENVEREFTVKNTGTAAFSATVALPADWSWMIPEGGAFQIPPAGEITARVVIRRRAPGELDETVRILNAPVRFMGRVVPPVLGSPSLLTLRWSAESRIREGVLDLQNNTPQPALVSLLAPPGLRVPAEVTIPAMESVKVPVTLTEKPESPLSGQILINVAGWSQSLKTEAAAAPASVIVEGVPADGVLDFGKMDPETIKTSEREIRLRNAGGTETSVTAQPPRNFTVTGLEEGAKLPPGGAVTIRVKPGIETPGVNEEAWLIRFAGGEQPVTFRAEVAQELSNAGMTTAPALKRTLRGDGETEVVKTVDQLRSDVRLSYLGLTKASPTEDRTLPTVNSVRVEKMTPTTVEFIWAPPGEGKWQYKVLVAQLRLMGPGKPPEKEFGELNNVKVTSDGATGRAVVTGLRPRQSLRARIVSVTADGRTSLPGEELFFPPQPLDKPFPWLWAGMWSLLAVGLILWRRSKKREEAPWKRR